MSFLLMITRGFDDDSLPYMYTHVHAGALLLRLMLRRRCGLIVINPRPLHFAMLQIEFLWETFDRLAVSDTRDPLLVVASATERPHMCLYPPLKSPTAATL